MSWNVVALSGVPAQPWRNGGGMTRELLAWPGPQEWVVRISVAQVAQDGPFSSFPGVTRWFAVLSGAGVQLDVDGEQHALTAADAPFQFDGGARTGCALIAGATEDFNLMVRGRDARMERIDGLRRAELAVGTLVGAFANKRRAVIRGPQQELELRPGEFAWRILETGLSHELIGEDALWMEIAP